MNQIQGYVESKLVSFLMNLHITPRSIYLVRHGESLNNAERKLGGDPELSERGKRYLPKLKKFFDDEKEAGFVDEKAKLFTSTLKRSIETAKVIDIGAKPASFKILDELDAGVCDNMTMEEVEKKYPSEWKARITDKLKYRFPMGESYIDLVHRIEPIIFAIERCKEPVIVVKSLILLTPLRISLGESYSGSEMYLWLLDEETIA